MILVIVILVLLFLLYIKYYRNESFVEIRSQDVSKIPGRWIDIIIPGETQLRIQTTRRTVNKKFYKPQHFQFKPVKEGIKYVTFTTPEGVYKINLPPNKSILTPDETNRVKSKEVKSRKFTKVDLTEPEFRNSKIITYQRGNKVEIQIEDPKVVTLPPNLDRILIETDRKKYVLDNPRSNTVLKVNKEHSL